MKTNRSKIGTRLLLTPVLATLLLALVTPTVDGAPKSVRTFDRQVTRIADGVYVIIHQDVSDNWPQGNTLVVIGDEGVFVVDACMLKKTAREDIEEIRKLTDKPIRYLAITHWHIDHNGGTSAYLEAYPNIAIVAQSETRRIMDAVNPGLGERYKSPTGPLATEISDLKRSLETGKNAEGAALTDDEKAALPRQIADREVQAADFANYRYVSPNVVFDSHLTVDLGGREVQCRYFGRGNTPGDTVFYLPKERIVAAGDLIVWPVPYMRGGYPSEWRETLAQISALNPSIIVPGHGEIERDMSHLNDVRALLDSVIDQVQAQITTATKVEDLKVDIESFRKRMTEDDPVNILWWNDLVVNDLVERVFLQARGRL